MYGSEVWGPYMNFDYTAWDKCKIEQVHVQYLKQILGCNFQTSNNMIRADTGSRPLINMVIKKFISYSKSIHSRKSVLCYDSVAFEGQNADLPNFCNFNNIFNLNSDNLVFKTKEQINKICIENYDRFWNNKILESTKAISFIKYKTRIALESHLDINLNFKYKTSLSRFRMSNHNLMIEKGRHLNIDRNNRYCKFCKNKIEDEQHFLINCPLYITERKNLEIICNKTCNKFETLTDEQKFIFIMSNENADIIKALGKFVFASMTIRDKMVTYFFS